ncbi:MULTISPECIES: flavin reductase family protein [Micromonospora]|uniref:flavin reductase family protein n=1 Tax=Micromonospora TaxID=1873 RepID=UPI0006AEA13C|nr:flavin reductase family protein [Micromonospora sp. NRRL B-16802]KOX03140.1 flavin reductase [Micromonospora sp. NRRL B-16802]
MDIHARPPAQVTDAKLLRRAFGAFATGVTVVTVGGATPHGMTANSFATVSLEPPLVLICVGREAVMHQVLSRAGVFAVSVLAAEQEAVARYFADRRRPLGREQFASVDWLPGPQTGAPLISGALAHFECELRRTYEGGDHSIFLGELLSMDRSLENDALLFVNGGFRQVEPKRSDVAI